MLRQNAHRGGSLKRKFDVEETKSLEVTSQTSGDTHLKKVMSPLTNSREHIVSVFVINKLS